MSSRTCSQCGSENDATRVFCANCGTRLPADSDGGSTGAPAPGAAPGGSAPPLPEPVRKRPPKRKSSGEAPGLLGFLTRKLISTAVVAALLAALIQVVREPDGLPARADYNTAAAKETLDTLRELADAKKPSSWTVNQNALNVFLATSVKMDQDGAPESVLTAKFERAFVRLGSGQFDLGVEQKFLTRSIYLLLDLRAETSSGGLTAKAVGGSIGRLPVHPSLLPLFMKVFQPTISGLSQPLGLLSRADSAVIKPEDVTLQWAGKPASGQ